MNENYCKKVLNRNAKCVILHDKVPCFTQKSALFCTVKCLILHDDLPQICLLLIINNVNTSN